jgi:hypothetical protein
MRFFIAAVIALGTMTIDFETNFKFEGNVQDTDTRSAFTSAAGEEETRSVERSINVESVAGLPETHELAVVREWTPQVENSVATEETPNNGFCEALRQAAEASNIPIAFFARLLWQESKFRSSIVSSAGAQGVAQFMPATAAEVGLDDPFDPYQALPASARFLRKLYNQFGNLGLAAAAYNAGPGRIQRWLSGRGILPRETRNYVRIITGNAAEDWLEEDKTVSMRSELPQDAPCEGVGGLSKAKWFAAIPVDLAASIGDTIKKAAVEAQRVTAEKLEVGAKAKTRVAKLLKQKMPLQLASRRTAPKMAALRLARTKARGSVHTAEAKRLVRIRMKAAQRPRDNDET